LKFVEHEPLTNRTLDEWNQEKLDSGGIRTDGPRKALCMIELESRANPLVKRKLGFLDLSSFRVGGMTLLLVEDSHTP
jgi:hypothetical protein